MQPAVPPNICHMGPLELPKDGENGTLSLEERQQIAAERGGFPHTCGNESNGGPIECCRFQAHRSIWRL